jgi:hypothetical protein
MWVLDIVGFSNDTNPYVKGNEWFVLLGAVACGLS